MRVHSSPPFFVARPRTSRSISSRTVSFSIGYGSFFNIRASLTTRKRHGGRVFRIDKVRNYRPIRRLLRFILILRSRVIAFSPPAGAVSICGICGVQVVVFLNGNFSGLFRFFLGGQVVQVEYPGVAFRSFCNVSFYSNATCMIEDSNARIVLSIIMGARARFRSAIWNALCRFFMVFVVRPNMFTFFQFRIQPPPACVGREDMLANYLILNDPMGVHILCFVVDIVVCSPARAEITGR